MTEPTRGWLDSRGKAIIAQKTAPVTVTIDDSPGWRGLAGTGVNDRAWPDVYMDMVDALEAWRKNFMIRRLVTLTRTFVVAGGITVSSKRRDVDKFLRAWWAHPKNRIATRLGPMSDELSRVGELFPTLHTNPIDGVSYLRFIPAVQITDLKTAPNDYETELEYGEQRDLTTELTWWKSPNLQPPTSNLQPLEPVMLHMAVNRVIGATRGEGDLTPVLKWALRYSNWLEDRVRLNRIRTRTGLLDIKITEDTQVEAKRQQLMKDDPMESGIYVHGSGETINYHALKIEASEAADDGKALRLAIAVGGQVGLHYLGEGAATNYATAREMGEPTARFYQERQGDVCTFLVELAAVAWDRYALVNGRRHYDDPAISAAALEVARADNAGLATAVKEVVEAFTGMKAQGWIDDETAAKLAFKFAGELMDETEIKRILDKSQKGKNPDPGQGDNIPATDETPLSPIWLQ